MSAPVGSVRWQLQLLGITLLGGVMGVVGLVVLGPVLWVQERVSSPRA